MSEKFTIIAGCEMDRLPLLTVPAARYNEMSEYIEEYLVVSRTVTDADLPQHDYPMRVIHYEYPGDTWVGASRALNIGVKAATTPRVIITSPEVLPITNVLKQFSMSNDDACLARVFDIDEKGERCQTLVSSTFRGGSPAMYFLGCFKKERIVALNGWDEEFLKGASYDDDDFGQRWLRAGFQYAIRDDAIGEHLYHPRSQVHKEAPNIEHYKNNQAKKVIRIKKGISTHTG